MSELEFSLSNRIHLKNEELKQKINQAVVEQRNYFLKQTEQFYERAHRDDAQYLLLCEAMIDAIEKIVQIKDWQTSLFLRNVIKPLLNFREEVLEIKKQLKDEPQTPKMLVPSSEETYGYLSLYQSNGLDLKKWALQLTALDRYIMGRPIYTSESAVNALIRNKHSQITEAYVVLIINKKDILAAEERLDRLGNSLLTLRSNSIFSKNIVEFVHMKKRYYFHENCLIEK